MTGETILLFDGHCGLCNACVDFVLNRDKTARFRFAALQSPTGKKMRADLGLGPEVDSMILIENGQAWIRSAAALGIARRLPLPWPLLGVFALLPTFLRDAVYEWLARRRLALFGRRESCRVPKRS